MGTGMSVKALATVQVDNDHLRVQNGGSRLGPRQATIGTPTIMSWCRSSTASSN